MPEAVEVATNQSLLAMVLSSGIVVQMVLILLCILSLWSWTITIAKFFQFRKARADTDEFNSIFWEARNFSRIEDNCKRLENSPMAQIFRFGYRELCQIMEVSGERFSSRDNVEADMQAVERALKRGEFEQGLRLERGTTFLATVASAAPFIGLFGTVWGIMTAFHGLSNMKSTTLQAVAPGISEALVATAIGLVAAIPAAVAYNYFVVAVRHYKEEMDKFSADFVTVARRYILK